MSERAKRGRGRDDAVSPQGLFRASRFPGGVASAGGTYAGGEQVARDEQGVLHGHYARSRRPSLAAPILRAPFCTVRTTAVGFI